MPAAPSKKPFFNTKLRKEEIQVRWTLSEFTMEITLQDVVSTARRPLHVSLLRQRYVFVRMAACVCLLLDVLSTA